MPRFLEDDGCNEAQPLDAMPDFDDDLLTLEDLENPEDAEAVLADLDRAGPSGLAEDDES